MPDLLCTCASRPVNASDKSAYPRSRYSMPRIQLGPWAASAASTRAAPPRRSGASSCGPPPACRRGGSAAPPALTGHLCPMRANPSAQANRSSKIRSWMQLGPVAVSSGAASSGAASVARPGYTPVHTLPTPRSLPKRDTAAPWAVRIPARQPICSKTTAPGRKNLPDSPAPRPVPRRQRLHRPAWRHRSGPAWGQSCTPPASGGPSPRSPGPPAPWMQAPHRFKMPPNPQFLVPARGFAAPYRPGHKLRPAARSQSRPRWENAA